MNLRSQKAPLIVGALVILGLAVYTTVYKSSPGELSKQHAAVAGSSFITDCNKCHGEKDVTVGCLKCHKEIQNQLTNKSGFHHFLLKDKPSKCAHCHSEHNGPDFQLINKVSWDNKDQTKFDHSHVDFKLKGKHNSLKCEDCHQQKNSTPFSMPDFPKQIREKSFLGLTQNCESCHKDPHAGGRIKNCEACHDQNKFRPSINFDHNRFFPLVGGHAKLECQKCHIIPSTDKTPGKTSFIEFRQVRGESCQSCHKSPHRTDWKTRCESCHKADDISWSLGSKRLTPIQHAMTTFKLTKPHDKASCTSCHNPQLPFEKKYPDSRKPSYDRQPNRCESCHQDPHGGQFMAKHPHCMDCHGLSGFKPIKFAVKDHSIYPLMGGHEKASCNDCHRISPDSKIRQFLKITRNCADCHRDIHMGQFRENGQTKCDSCHNSFVSWKKTSFNHNKQSRFPLDDAHKNIACSACHPLVTLKNNVRVVQYKPIRSRCEDCHSVEGAR